MGDILSATSFRTFGARWPRLTGSGSTATSWRVPDAAPRPRATEGSWLTSRGRPHGPPRCTGAATAPRFGSGSSGAHAAGRRPGGGGSNRCRRPSVRGGSHRVIVKPDAVSFEEIMLGRRLGLLERYEVLERLDLFEDLDVIQHLDGLSTASES